MRAQGAAPILQYGKVQFVNGGDIIHASELISSGDDHRDASFVRVSICQLMYMCVAVLIILLIMIHIYMDFLLKYLSLP